MFLRGPQREDSIREVENGFTIYSDIDEVIHDYRKPFYRELLEKFNIEVDNATMPGEHDLKKPLTSMFGLPERDFDDLIEHVNGLEEWVPTEFSHHLISFLKMRKEKGDTVLFVTARTSRRGAKHIIKQAFGEDLPIIQCDSFNKKYVVRNKSLFFEDRGDTIEYCSERNPESLIVAPEWPWNSYLEKKAIKNVVVCPQNDFERVLREIDVLLDITKKMEK